jgi:membrane-associated phospholipid phosphatase
VLEMAVAVRPARAQTLVSPSETAPKRRRDLVRLNWIGPAVYFAVLATWVATRGLPLSRTSVALWLIAGMLAFTLHDLHRWIEGVMLEWLPFVAFLLVYDVARSYANLLRSTTVMFPIDGDRLLFAGHVPTVWLQRHLWHGVGGVRWYDYACWGVYMTYFFGTLAVAAGIWIFAYERFRRYVAMVALLSAAGFATYVLFPVAPPWYASSHGQLGPAQRLTGAVWQHALPSFSTVVEHGQSWANPVAAMPSLHAGFTLLITLYLWKTSRWWARIPLAAYPVLMGFTLAYFGEHYVTDILAGWVYAGAAYLLVERIANRRAIRRAAGTSLAAAEI